MAGSSAIIANPTEMFSGDELEYMAFLRRRVTSSPSHSSSLPASTGGDEGRERGEFSGHEFIDPDFITHPNSSGTDSSSSPSEEDPDLELAVLRDAAGSPADLSTGGEEEAFGHLEDWERSS